MSKYTDRLSRTKDQLSADAVKVAEAKAKADVETAIAQGKSAILNAQSIYEAALGANPFNLKVVAQAKKQVAEAEADVALASSLLSELFG